jgi:hypothetical protein
MIVQEHFIINGRDFIRTTSNELRYVVRDGVSYSEACDPAEFGRVYTEGEPIDGIQPEEAALTRYANELTGSEDGTLTEATKTLIKKVMEEK